MLDFVFYFGTLKGNFTNFLSIQYYPLLLLICFFAIIFCPFNIMYKSGRIGLLQTLLQVLISPFGTLGFRHFFLADILCSMVKPLNDIAHSTCFFATGEWLGKDGQCDILRKYYNGPIALIPYTIRLLQCLKKYFQTYETFPHIVNAGKYFMSMLAIALSTALDMLDLTDTWCGLKYAWVIFLIISTLYSFLWDVLVDWRFFQRNSKHPFLRDDILVPKKIAFYYLAIVFDFLLRFFWALSISPKNLLLLRHEYWILIVSVVEIFRRCFWAFFRVENEALSNLERYRAIDFVPPLNKNAKRNIESNGSKEQSLFEVDQLLIHNHM